MKNPWIWRSVVLLALSGCASDGAVTGAAPQTDQALYVAAVERSAVFDAANVRPLRPLSYPVAALMLTNNSSWAIGQEGKTVALTSSYGTWVTVEPEVKEFCQGYRRDELIRKLHYLLGLQPAVPADDQARFVRFTVAKQDLGPTGAGIFRPCPDPDPTRTACANAIKGPPDFVSWFASQQVFSYRKGPEIVFTQLTKADVLAFEAGGQHVADLDIGVGDDHAVDEQQHELPALFKGGVSKPMLHAYAESLQ